VDLGRVRSSGGFLADRTKRPRSIIVASCIVVAILMVLLPRGGAVVLTIIALGLISASGRSHHEPASARTAAADRAIGMGLFFTMFYACMMLGPVVGGACAKWAGSAAAAFDFGAALILGCPLVLWASIAFRQRGRGWRDRHLIQPPLTTH